MKERALRIGRPTPLIGVLSEPDNFDPDKPMVLILNSGIMHHIGTCRLSVKIARSLAKEGLASVRFDYSSIGDSAPRRGAEAFEESAPREAAEVMDYLTSKRGVKKFILYGLCSGADAAYTTALVDDRVIAIGQIDAYCYKTPRFYLKHYLPRFLSFSVWQRFFKRKLAALVSGVKKSDIEEMGEFFEMASYVREFPSSEEIAAGLKKLCDRNVAMKVIFTGGESAYNYREQYRDSFKRKVEFRDLLEVEYYPACGHIITQPPYQKIVVEELTQWMLKQAA